MDSELAGVLAAFEEELADRLGRLRPLAERLPDNAMAVRPGAVHDLFRELHSLKGAANLLGFHLLGALAHRLEELLSNVRERRVRVDAQVRRALLEGIGQIEQLGENLCVQGDLDEGDKFSAFEAATEPDAEE